jgi:DNA-binding SARP family transcriptional activator
MTVRRERILQRVAESGSRLISIVAPAGFGKTTVAEMIGAEIGTVLLCDAVSVGNVFEFAACIVRALQRDAPEREAALAHDLFVHVQPGVSSAQLAGFVVEAWESIDTRSVYIIDNLEAIAEQTESLDLLLRLIKRAGRRTLVLSSRPPLPLVNSRVIPPHEHLRLGMDDLAFTAPEIARVFENGIDAATLARVVEITQGWPVAVLLLAQLARLGRLEHALDESAGTELEDLHEYLLREVMSSIPQRLSEVLLALAATHSSRGDAALRASDGAATQEALKELAQRFPLVRYSAGLGRYRVHPLIVSFLERTAAPEIQRYRLAAAQSYDCDGIHSEAARLYLDAGQPEVAAQTLERFSGPYIEYDTFGGLEDVVNRLPSSILAKFPRLWAALVWVRRSFVPPDVIAAEGKLLRDLMPYPADSLEAQQVDAILLHLLTAIGDHDYSARILSEREIDPEPKTAGGISLLLGATIRDMLMGQTSGARANSRRVLRVLRNGTVRGYFILRVDALLDTMAGRFEEAKIGHERALQYAQSSGPARVVAGLLPDRAFVAWLAGDDAAVDRYFDEILGMSGAVGSAELRALADAWFRGGDAPHATGLLPRERAYALLLLAGRARDEARAELLDEALASARQARDAWTTVLCLTAKAMAEPPLRSQYLEEALATAELIGLPEVKGSIHSLLAGGTGGPTLASLAARFAPVEVPPEVPDVLRIDTLSRTVWQGGRKVALSNRALTLVLTLAVLKSVRRGELAELLWGDEAADSGLQALKMLVFRARSQLGDPSLIVATNGRYALRADVPVDFDEIERLLRSLSAHDPLTELQREALRSAYDRFKRSAALRDPNGRNRSIEAAIGAMRHRVIDRLGRDALDRGDITFAFELADELRRLDDSDEAAYELLIRAYIRSGNRSSAVREYRKYSDHLMQDLGLTPSFSLEDLFEKTTD